MPNINQEIENMASAMEKSTETPKDQLFKTLKDLGSEGIKAKLVAKSEDGTSLLSDDEKVVLKDALEEIKKGNCKCANCDCVDCTCTEEMKKGGPGSGKRSLSGKVPPSFEPGQRSGRDVHSGTKYKTSTSEQSAIEINTILNPKKDQESRAEQRKREEARKVNKAASPSMDDSYQAKYVQGNVYRDTIIQEDKADDDQDEKMVKPGNAKINHQGDNNPEGIEGQVIKAKDAIDIAGDADETADGAVNKIKKKCDMKKPAVMGKNYGTEKNYDMDKMKKMKKSIEDEMKAEGIEPTLELVKGKMKALLMEEKQSEDNMDDMQNDKTRGDKSRPEALKVEKENKAAQDKVNDLNQGKMKKAMGWADQNALLAANTGGRNHNFSINNYYEEVLTKAKAKEEKPKEEVLAKSEDAAKEEPKPLDTNDFIEKSMDCTQDEVISDARLLINKAIVKGRFTKSFQENEIAQALGLTGEEAKKILGE